MKYVTLANYVRILASIHISIWFNPIETWHSFKRVWHFAIVTEKWGREMKWAAHKSYDQIVIRIYFGLMLQLTNKWTADLILFGMWRMHRRMLHLVDYLEFWGSHLPFRVWIGHSAWKEKKNRIKMEEGNQKFVFPNAIKM